MYRLTVSTVSNDDYKRVEETISIGLQSALVELTKHVSVYSKKDQVFRDFRFMIDTKYLKEPGSWCLVAIEDMEDGDRILMYCFY